MSMSKKRLSWSKQRHVANYFLGGTIARAAAIECDVNRKNSAYYLRRLRQIIFYELEQEADAASKGEREVDESYFGGKRKGKRQRGAAGKTFVFDLIKHGGKI